LKTNNT